MTELIFSLILIGSIAGMGVIVFRKMPILTNLPEDSPSDSFKPQLKGLYKEIKNIPGLRSFSSEAFLRKTLSKIRLLSLKTDNKTSSWLQKLKERSQKEKIEENDNYWQELKKTTKHK